MDRRRGGVFAHGSVRTRKKLSREQDFSIRSGGADQPH
jgi:hypothetical protein